jgi:hypothetical protein
VLGPVYVVADRPVDLDEAIVDELHQHAGGDGLA